MERVPAAQNGVSVEGRFLTRAEFHRLADVPPEQTFEAKPVWKRMVVILAVSPVVLAPWTFEVLRSPSLLLTEAGVPGPGLSEPDLAPWAVLLQHTGGPGAAPIWFGASLLLAGWAALLRVEGRRPIVVAWVVALTGLGLGLLVSRRPVTGPTLETPVAGWPGYPVVLVAALLADDDPTTGGAGAAGLEPTLGPAVGLSEVELCRDVLETCADVDEALEALRVARHCYFLHPQHFLIADRSGRSFVYEFSPARNGEHVLWGEGVQVVTNHLLYRYPTVADLPSGDGKGFTYARFRA